MTRNDGFDDEHVQNAFFRPDTLDAANPDTTGKIGNEVNAGVPDRDDREEDAPEGRWQADLPGQPDTDKSAAGQEQGGQILDTVNAADDDPSNVPGETGVNSSGNSMGDDDDLPGAERVREQQARLDDND